LKNEIAEGVSVRADGDRLQQVFFNLVENAIKYGRNAGEVVIGCRPGKNGMIEAWVKDDGPGIPKEASERIFERFFRVDKARSRETGGTGLGLAIVKHIVQTHGGEVWVESEVGQGTTFFFSVPLPEQADLKSSAEIKPAA
jgi:two-component system phosphate regulon sensor histidine kinase PhoR